MLTSAILIILYPRPISQEKFTLRTDLPTDDLTCIIYADSTPDETQNSDILGVGCFEYTYKWSIMRFSLIDKPENWTECEIRIYIPVLVNTGSKTPISYYNLIMDYDTWNENMSYTDFINTWGSWGHTVNFSGSYSNIFNARLGFLRIDITEHIENHDTITIRFRDMYPDDFDYSSHAYINIHSKEADVDNKFKPQLIWS